MEEPIICAYSRPRCRNRLRERLILWPWLGLMAAVLAVQGLTAGTFETGHWTPQGDTPATAAENTWYYLPLAMVLLISVVFFVLSKRRVSAIEYSTSVRVLGAVAALLSLVISFLMSTYYSIQWYMD